MTSEVVWDVELPDERTDEPSVLIDECAGIDKGRVSGLGTWVGFEGGRAINVADGTLTDQVDERAEEVLRFFGDLTGSSDGKDFQVMDPATGDVVFSIDPRLADQRGFASPWMTSTFGRSTRSGETTSTGPARCP